MRSSRRNLGLQPEVSPEDSSTGGEEDVQDSEVQSEAVSVPSDPVVRQEITSTISEDVNLNDSDDSDSVDQRDSDESGDTTVPLAS